jgi:hypothetical protein
MSDIAKLLEKATGKKDEIMQQLTILSKECEKKMGIPASAVMDKYEQEFKSLKSVMNTKDENIIAGRAWARVKGYFRQELRSPALIFNGMILGVTEPFDMVRSAKKLAAALFAEDKAKAIKEGYCNEAGEALDNKKAFGNGNANPNYGKVLPEHNYIRNVIGICEHEGEKKLFSMMMGDRLVNLKVPTMVPVTFRANVAKTQNEQDILSLNPYTKIVFEPNGTKPSDYIQESSKVYEQYMMVLGDIQTYHNSNAGPKRFCIVEADVMYIDSVPNATTGNRMMVLEDDSLPSGHNGVTTFIPPSIDIDFGSGSRVVVCAQTNETSYQAEEGEVNYIMNITGLFAIPEMKVPADEVPQSAVQKVN